MKSIPTGTASARRLKTGVRDIRLPGRRRGAAAAVPISSSSKITICSSCNQERAKYTCPKCHAVSCSLKCYRAHDGKCTEPFYQEQVQKELAYAKPSKADKEKAVAALKRDLEAKAADDPLPVPPEGPAVIRRANADPNREDDEQEVDEEHERLLRLFQQMAVSGKFDPKRLDAQTEKKFRKMAADGRLADLFKPWDPWWCPPPSPGDDKERQKKDYEIHGWRALAPMAPKVDDLEAWPHKGLSASVPKPRILSVGVVNTYGEGNGSSTKRELSAVDIPSLRYLRAPTPTAIDPRTKRLKLLPNLVELLFTYAFTKRLYNGEWEEDRKGAGSVVFTVSDVLDKSAVLPSVGAAIRKGLENAERVAGVTHAFAVEAVRDTARMLFYHTLSLRALADFQCFLETLAEELREDRRQQRLNLQKRQQQQQQARRIENPQTVKSAAKGEADNCNDNDKDELPKTTAKGGGGRGSGSSQEERTVVLSQLPEKTATMAEIKAAKDKAIRLTSTATAASKKEAKKTKPNSGNLFGSAATDAAAAPSPNAAEGGGDKTQGSSKPGARPPPSEFAAAEHTADTHCYEFPSSKTENGGVKGGTTAAGANDNNGDSKRKGATPTKAGTNASGHAKASNEKNSKPITAEEGGSSGKQKNSKGLARGRKSKKKSGSASRGGGRAKVARAAKKLCYFCAIVNEVVQEETLRALGNDVGRLWCERMRRMEETKAVAPVVAAALEPSKS